MKIAMLPVAVADHDRTTTLTRSWIERACDAAVRYVTDQSGGRATPEFTVFDWIELPLTSQEWLQLGGDVSPTVNAHVRTAFGPAALAGMDRFIYVIDDGVSGSGVTGNDESRIGASSFDPAILCHELTHVYGADDSFLDEPDGPARYEALFCVMGHEGRKHSFADEGLLSADEGADAGHTDSGPGMCVPTLLATGWLDLAQHGHDVTGWSHAATGGVVRIPALDGAPAPGGGKVTFCYLDHGPDRYLVEYRSPHSRWDAGLPSTTHGWIVVHRTPIDGPLTTLEVASFQAVPGTTVRLAPPGAVFPPFPGGPPGPPYVSVLAHDASQDTVDLRVAAPRAQIPWHEQHERPPVGFEPDDVLVHTPTLGWRVIPRASDLNGVLARVADLDAVRELTRMSGRRYGQPLDDATASATEALRAAVNDMVVGATAPPAVLLHDLDVLHDIVRRDHGTIDKVALTDTLDRLRATASLLP